MKKTQEEITYEIMTVICPARSELIKIACMRRGISCGDRYVRWLAKRGIVENIGKVKSDDRTDTYVIKKPYSPAEKKPQAGQRDTLFPMDRFRSDI